MAQPIQFSAEKMKAAKKLFLQKKNKIRPVCGGQAVSTEDSTTLPTIQEKDGPEDGHQGLPEQQQQTVDQVKMRRNSTVPSDREEEHPGHRVQTRRMSTATSAVKEPRNQSGNCVPMRPSAVRKKQDIPGDRVPTRPMLTSAVRKKQDNPGDRVQTRRMSTALQQQQDHLEWSAVGDSHALELPGNNMKTQANRVKKPSANRERQEQRGRTRRLSAESSAVREEEEHLEKPGAYKLPGRNIKPHSNRGQARRLSTAPSVVRQRQEHPGKAVQEPQEDSAWSSVGELHPHELPGHSIKTPANRVQTRRMSAAPSAVREQQEHPRQSSVSDREQLPARTQRKQKTMKVAFVGLPLETGSETSLEPTSAERNLQVQSPTQSIEETHRQHPQQSKAEAKTKTSSLEASSEDPEEDWQEFQEPAQVAQLAIRAQLSGTGNKSKAVGSAQITNNNYKSKAVGPVRIALAGQPSTGFGNPGCSSKPVVAEQLLLQTKETQSAVEVCNSQDAASVEDSKSADGWEIHGTVPTAEVASTVLKIEFGFRAKSANYSNMGTKRYYDCRRIKFRAKPQCGRKLLVFIPNSDDPATISISGKHTCTTAPPENLARSKLNPQQSELVEGLLRAGIPSKDVKKHVRVVDSAVSKNQLNYAVKTTKQKLFGNGVLSLGELESWATSKSAVPREDREGFVIGKDIDHENKSFRIVFSSKRLLSLLALFSVVAADCTFKVTVEGYPLLVVAVIDNMRHTHPIAFAVISNQEQSDYKFVFQAIRQASLKFGFEVAVTSFMSDGELALKNAARAVFDRPTILNCYFHFTQLIDRHLKKYQEVPVELRDELKLNIGTLQVSPTEQHFIVGMKLFLEKYDRFPHFMTFMNKYVNDPNFCLWYEAAKPAAPATNNGLEAINKSLKYNHLNRFKEPLASFKAIILNVVYEYGDPKRKIFLEPDVANIKNERSTFEWLKKGNRMRFVKAPMERKQYVFLPGKSRTEVTLHDMESFDNPDYRTFEQFKEDFGSLHRVDVTNVDWKTWSCTCFLFWKNNYCCHILAVAVKRGKHTLSAEADTTVVGRKKSAGRPKLVSKALIVD